MNLGLLSLGKDKKFLRTITTVAIPVALQNSLTSLLNALDTVMISRLGDTSVAAVGLANEIFFVYILICFGISSGSAVFFAQYWGKKDIKSVKKVMGIAIMIAGIVGLLFTVAAVLFPEVLMRLFITDADVVAEGSKYLGVVCFSYVITAISLIYVFCMRATGNARTPLVATFVSVIVNTVLNYCLIFGKFGFPELGVKGAALATVFARIVEISVLFATIKFKRSLLDSKISELMAWDIKFLSIYMRTTAPVIINETLWAVGQALYIKAYAGLGKEAASAVQIYSVVINLCFVLVRGLASSCQVMIGNMIGEGSENEEIIAYSKKFLAISTLLGIIIGFSIANATPLILPIFNNLSDTVYDMATSIIKIMGYLFVVRAFNSVAIVGVLRGGGDTRVSTVIEMSSIWLVGVPLAFFGTIILKLPIQYAMLLVSLDEIEKMILEVIRIKSGKWIHNVTV